MLALVIGPPERRLSTYDLYAEIIDLLFILLMLLAATATITTLISPPKIEDLDNWPPVFSYPYFIGCVYSVHCTIAAFGLFGRGEDPASPCSIIRKYYSIGSIDGYFSGTRTIRRRTMANMDSCSYLRIHFSGGNKTKIRMARIINLLVGLLSFMPGNILYRMINTISPLLRIC